MQGCHLGDSYRCHLYSIITDGKWASFYLEPDIVVDFRNTHQGMQNWKSVTDLPASMALHSSQPGAYPPPTSQPFPRSGIPPGILRLHLFQPGGTFCPPTDNKDWVRFLRPGSHIILSVLRVSTGHSNVPWAHLPEALLVLLPDSLLRAQNTP